MTRPVRTRFGPDNHGFERWTTSMHARRRRSRLLVILGGAGLASLLALALWGLGPQAPPVHADLEVSLPPGPAVEWFGELPQRFPFVRGGQIKKKAAPKKPDEKHGKHGSTTRRRGSEPEEQLVVEERPMPGLGGSYQPMFFAGVKTEDLPIHLTWVSRKTDASPPKYPPAVTDDLYWMAQAAYLRRLLHPSLVGENEILWSLIALGPAAREVGGPARGEAFLTPLIDEIEKRIPKLPARRPKPPKLAGASAEDKMLMQVAVDDLIDMDGLSLNPTFCWRTLSRGEKLFPQLEACVKSDHPLLRRNGVLALAHFKSEGALAAIRELFRTDWDKDPVAGTRALIQLLARGDKEIVPDLLKILAASDERARPLAASALGRLGDKQALRPLVEIVKRAGKDSDTLTQAVIGLGRLGDASPATLDALHGLQKKLERSAVYKQDRAVPRPQADIPDPAALRNRVLLEVTVVALARLGDKTAQRDLMNLLRGGWYDTKTPRGFANASGPDRNGQVKALQLVCPTTIPSLCEALAGLGKHGLSELRRILLYPKTPTRLKTDILQYPEIQKDKRLVRAIAAGDAEPPVKSAAMKILYNVDSRQAIKLAQGIVQTYARGRPLRRGAKKGDATVIAALEIAYRAKKLKAKTLRAVCARAARDYEYTPPKVTAEGVAPFRFSPPILEVAVFLLGATRDRGALGLLRSLARNPKLPGRAEAALALAKVKGGPKVLLDLLDDRDPWVRYSAYLGLKTATGQDAFCDWIYGRKAKRRETIKRWNEIVKALK